MRYIRQFFKSIKRDLFTIDNKKLHPIAIFLLIALDLFVLLNIERGIQNALIKAPPPYIRYPYQYKELFTKPLTYERIEEFVIRDRNRTAPLCKNLYNIISRIKKDPTYRYNYSQYHTILTQLTHLKEKHQYQLQQYNNTLLEKIAKEETKRLPYEKTKFYNQYKKIQELQKKLSTLPKPTDLKIVQTALLPFIQKNRELFFKQKRRYTFNYPFIYFYFMLKFLLPLLLIAGSIFYITRNSNTTKAKVIHLLSTHLLLIAALPAIFYTLHLIYDIIPKKFITLVLQKLYEWGVVYLGYYFLIFIAAVIIGYAIYRILKRAPIIERAKRVKLMRLKKRQALQNSRCLQCSMKVDYYQDNFCQGCGNELLANCPYCNKKIPKIAPYCRYCGKHS